MMSHKKRIFSGRMRYPALLIMLITAASAHADEQRPKPAWEVGVGAGVVSLPQYMGSDERYTLAIPIPYLVYRGKRVKVDRNGIRAELFGLKQLTLDASFGAGLPVRNSNRARAGMPELKFNFQAGPRLNWHMIETDHADVKLRLPWRGIIDVSGSTLGWLIEPDVQWRWRPTDRLNLRFNAGALYASRRYNETYYSVAPQYVTPTRAAYRAGGGLHSLSAAATMSYGITDHLRLFGTLRYRNLSPGVIAASPLVRDRNYLIIAAGFTWSIWQSEQDAHPSSREE